MASFRGVPKIGTIVGSGSSDEFLFGAAYHSLIWTGDSWENSNKIYTALLVLHTNEE